MTFSHRNQTSGLCSATILSRYTILTAAHCVSHLKHRNKNFINIQKKRFRIKKIHTLKSFKPAQKKFLEAAARDDLCINTSLCSEIREEVRLKYVSVTLYDIALINLVDTLKGSVNIISLDFDPPAPWDPIHMVGHGFVKHSLDKGFYLQPKVPYIKKGALEVLPNGIYAAFGLYPSDYLTAPGDSGGALLNEQYQQIGIISGAYTNERFESGSIFVPLRVHEDFIDKFMIK